MMMQLNGFCLGDIFKNQIIQSIFILTLFYSIYSKPHEKNVGEPLLDLKSESVKIDLERQRVIADLKTRILTLLNLKDSPKPQRAYDWDTIPDEMKDLLNSEIEEEEKKVDQMEDKLETIISPLLPISSCRHNQSVNKECFNGTIPNLDMDEIINARLIAPLRKHTSTAFGTLIQYNISMNDHQMMYDFNIGRKQKDKVEISMLHIFKKLMANVQDTDEGANVTTLFIMFEGFLNTFPISQIIDTSKMVLEVQYKVPTSLRRSKRNADMCQPNEYFCCTQSMSVNIDELGWTHFIVAPRSFIINYCKGDCNNYLTYSSNHAKAMNLLRNRNMSERKETRSCCVPYSFSNQTIMYQTNDFTLKITTFTNFIASTCGCL